VFASWTTWWTSTVMAPSPSSVKPSGSTLPENASIRAALSPKWAMDAPMDRPSTRTPLGQWGFRPSQPPTPPPSILIEGDWGRLQRGQRWIKKRRAGGRTEGAAGIRIGDRSIEGMGLVWGGRFVRLGH
jgi:hypothetical protein